MTDNIHYTFDFIDTKNIKKNKLIEVKAADAVAAKKKILKFRNKYDIPRQWAVDLSGKVKTQFCSASIISKYDEILMKIIGEGK